MYIGRMYFPVRTLGYGNRIGIWVCGCQKNCRNCVSPELRELHAGKWIESTQIIKNIELVIKEADGVTISGGEPFDQPKELRLLVEGFIAQNISDILIYSGYTLEELKQLENSDIDFCLSNIAVLIDGRYVDEQNDGKGIRGSANQNIYVWKHQERYLFAETCQRKQQCVELNDRLVFIGIPKETSYE